MTKEEFLKKAKWVEEFWRDDLPLMAAEESGELIQAISKLERYKHIVPFSTDGLVHELADVTICIAALCYRYGIDYNEVEKQVEKKLNLRYV